MATTRTVISKSKIKKTEMVVYKTDIGGGRKSSATRHEKIGQTYKFNK